MEEVIAIPEEILWESFVQKLLELQIFPSAVTSVDKDGTVTMRVLGKDCFYASVTVRRKEAASIVLSSKRHPRGDDFISVRYHKKMARVIRRLTRRYAEPHDTNIILCEIDDVLSKIGNICIV